MQYPGKERYSDGACEVNRRQKWWISGVPSRWMTVAQKFMSVLQLCVLRGKQRFHLKTKTSQLHLFFILCPSNVSFHDYIPHCGCAPDTPELGLIVIHLHLPCHKLQIPFFSPPLTPDAAISVNPFAPRGGNLSFRGVSARRESSSFRLHFLSFSFSSSHFFPRE